jgi:hypothetical protein
MAQLASCLSAIGGFLLLVGCHASDTKPANSFSATLDRADIVALDTLTGRGLLAQCSREAPKGVIGLWRPDSALPAESAAALESELNRRLHAEIAGDSPLGQAWRGKTLRYRAQLLGIRRSIDSVIYVNGFIRDSESDSTWRTYPFVACDGGSGYFGVEYNPTTRQLSGFSFNGRG